MKKGETEIETQRGGTKRVQRTRASIPISTEI